MAQSVDAMTAVSYYYNKLYIQMIYSPLFSVSYQEILLVVLQAALDAAYKYFVKQFNKHYTCVCKCAN